MADILRHEDFDPYVGELFRFEGWHGALRLTQIEVGHHRQIPGTPRPPFSLLFSGPRGDVLAEGLYQAQAGNSPVFEIYVTPIHTPAPDRQDYQAVFN